MAEINEAYAALTRDGGAAGRRWPADGEAARRRGEGRGGRRRGNAPGRPAPAAPDPAGDRLGSTRPTRSGRATRPIRPAGAAGARRADRCRGQPPLPRPAGRARAAAREHADRAAGPVPAPQLPPARRPAARTTRSSVELAFGKFHGHTLGQVAAFEPSYIDWLATTITRDPRPRRRRPGSSATTSTDAGDPSRRAAPTPPGAADPPEAGRIAPGMHAPETNDRPPDTRRGDRRCANEARAMSSAVSRPGPAGR